MNFIWKDTNKIVVIDSAQYRNIKDYSILRGKIIVMRTCVNTCYQRCLERWSSNNQYNEEEYQKYVNKKKNISNWYHSLNKFIENIDKMWIDKLKFDRYM